MAAIRVVFSGAAGNIGYALAPRLVDGTTFGSDQPIDLVLLELPQAADKCRGLAMELTDCAFPMLNSITVSTDAEEAFTNADYIVLVGARPRGPGMDRADLLAANAPIFVGQGKAIEKAAKKTCKVLVVGNPANTNCLIAATNAPSIPRENFQALTRLDQNRMVGQIAERCGVLPGDVHDVFIFGNHSNTMVPVVDFGYVMTAEGRKTVREAVNDDEWLDGEFQQTVKTRGGAIIKARGSSSAMSAANATVDALRSWHRGTNGEIVSCSVITDGTAYGAPEGVVCSMPVRCNGGKMEIVRDLELSASVRSALDATVAELVKERGIALQ